MAKKTKKKVGVKASARRMPKRKTPSAKKASRISSRKTTARRSSHKPAARAIAPAPTADAPAQFAGFDTGSYPGDRAIAKWAAGSPYSFVGFYFDAPCHTRATFKTWQGKFPVIKTAGFGLIIIYVGFQQDGCGKANLSRAKGLEHGIDTIDKFKAEGFPDNAIVFLDVEHFAGDLSAPMEAYIRGWISSLLDFGKITTGIYCPASKANAIRLAAEREFAAHGLPGGAPVFWIVKVAAGFNIATSKPTGCGVSFASVWQGRLDIDETHGGVTIRIDQNVADSRDPSRAT
jgi:hypothetical protein